MTFSFVFFAPFLDWVGSCMNEKEPLFSPVFYILVPILFLSRPTPSLAIHLDFVW